MGEEASGNLATAGGAASGERDEPPRRGKSAAGLAGTTVHRRGLLRFRPARTGNSPGLVLQLPPQLASSLAVHSPQDRIQESGTGNAAAGTGPCPSPAPASTLSGETPLPTHFAPPERSSAEVLREQRSFVSGDAVVDALLNAVSGLVAVLNENRQVLLLNPRMLQALGITDAAAVTGLRLGEVVGCVHADKGPAGCGTTEYCSTCGAAIAQVTSLQTAMPVERTCAIDLKHPVFGSDQIFLRVHACPLRREGRQLLLLFLQDISDVQQRAALDRAFYHDVKNTLCGMVLLASVLGEDKTRPDAEMAANLARMARRLEREIELQRCLSTMSLESFEKTHASVDLGELLQEITLTYRTHPEAIGRRLEVISDHPAGVIVTDRTLLHRVLHNMILNALEATPPGGSVMAWIETPSDAVEFCVWNEAVIPPEIARRVFQRNFSTKASTGRGLGTYSMKLVGERLLGGQVRFTSKPGEGTCFRFRLTRSFTP